MLVIIMYNNKFLSKSKNKGMIYRQKVSHKNRIGWNCNCQYRIK